MVSCSIKCPEHYPQKIELDSIRKIFITYQIPEFFQYQLKMLGPYKVFIIGTFSLV